MARAMVALPSSFSHRSRSGTVPDSSTITDPRLATAGTGRARASAAVLAEVRDALQRRQPELHSALLAGTDLPERLRAARGAAAVSTQALEAEMVRTHGTVLRPGTPFASAVWIDGAPLDAKAFDGLLTGALRTLVVVDRLLRAAREAGDRLASAFPDAEARAVEADAALELPLPQTLPRPLLVAIGGDALGSRGTVDVVRVFRMVRAAMRPGDRLLLGADLRTDRQALLAAWGDPAGPIAAWHHDLLTTLPERLGAGLDPQAFAFEVRHDAETRRTETHLVARRRTLVIIPGLEPIEFARGASIRTGTACATDRRRLTGALTGCALSIAHWVEDGTGNVAVVVAEPAS